VSPIRYLEVLVALLIVLGISACTAATKDTAISPQIRSLFQGEYKVDPYMEEHRPITVAVLPFLDKSGSKKGAAEVRKGFYNHFSSLPFRDMELTKVDNLLFKAGLTDPEVIYKTPPQELGKILNVDAVVFGEISNFDKLFAVVYSQVAVGAEIKMYDAKTGHFLWSGKHTVRIHEGGISTTPVGIIATVISTAMNVRDIQLLRACDDLFRDMVKTIPTPTVAEALKPPVITLLTQDTRNEPKKAGDEIRVVIQGTPKMQAYFDIGDYKKRIEMEEVEPGGYLGVYKVLPGDNVSQAMITGYLRDEQGNVAQWVDALGYVTLDTTPPEKVKSLKTLGRNNLLLLSWEKCDASDLAYYRLYRSETPLSGFQAIAKTEFNEWRDDKVTNGKKYYYYVTAVDRAGNESEKGEVVVGMPLAPGPTYVGGSVEENQTWYAGASPYVITDTIIVKDKAKLSIEPGTEIKSRGPGIIVRGQLEAIGGKENIITFSTAEETKIWQGIIFENVKEKENILKFVHIRNAEIAVQIVASSPFISRCELTENETAVKVVGAFSQPSLEENIVHKNKNRAVIVEDGAKPKLIANEILDNKEGILVQNAAPDFTRNQIARNGGNGVTLLKSDAQFKENTFIDNRPFDLSAETEGDAVKAQGNWWGTTKGLEILNRLRGKVDVSAILDGPYPQGKIIRLPILHSPLGGEISEDAYLTLSHSPYQVSKDVVVKNGATLYIERGVEIRYEQNRSFIVEDGGIVAIGTREMPIKFLAASASPTPGFYVSAVKFTKATKVNSIFSFCIVKYAQIAFDIHYGAPEISHSIIAHNSQGGIICRNDAAPKILYSTFLNNLGEGAIRVVGMARPTINYNNFMNNAFAIQAFSTIYIDARHNWWGKSPPEASDIFKYSDDSINISPWLEKPEEKAFRE